MGEDHAVKSFQRADKREYEPGPAAPFSPRPSSLKLQPPRTRVNRIPPKSIKNVESSPTQNVDSTSRQRKSSSPLKFERSLKESNERSPITRGAAIAPEQPSPLVSQRQAGLSPCRAIYDLMRSPRSAVSTPRQSPMSDSRLGPNSGRRYSAGDDTIKRFQLWDIIRRYRKSVNAARDSPSGSAPDNGGSDTDRGAESGQLKYSGSFLEDTPEDSGGEM